MDTKAEKLYHALLTQLDGKDSAPLKANGGRWPNHDRLVTKGNSRIIFNDDESISVRYHSTVIVTVEKDGAHIILNSGGYRTYSTKARMNEIARLGQDGYESAYQVWQKDFEWFVNDDPFYDGIIVND